MVSLVDKYAVGTVEVPTLEPEPAVVVEVAPAVELPPAEVSEAAPYNKVTGVAYKGGNIMRLLVAEAENGYQGSAWAGFKQWLSVGRVVRKGEHGTACITVVSVVDKKGHKGTRPRAFKVFHFDQTAELGMEVAS